MKWIKGNNSFRLQHFFDMNKADWKKSKLCDYLAYKLGKIFLFKETPFILTL